jgi:dipeptidyl aminopeptidase/acylaminoacyl peptidase
MSLLALLAAAAIVPPSVQRFADLSISPDGKLLAWIGPMPADASGTGPVGVVIMDRRSRRARFVTGTETGPRPTEVAWSADSHTIALLFREKGEARIETVVEASGEKREVATIHGVAHALRLSPDGRHAAVLYSTPDEQAYGPTEAAPRDTGVIDDHVDRQHLAVIDLATGNLRVVSPADLYIYEYDWSPDGRRLVVSGATGSGNNNWWVARLYTVPADSGAATEIARPATQIAVPRWSPDGSEIAYIGGIMSDQGSTGGDVWTVSAAGGTPSDLTPSAHVSPADLSWVGSAHQMMVAAWAPGATEIDLLDTRTGALRTEWRGGEQATTGGRLPGLSSARDGQAVAVVRESPNTPPEVWAGPADHLAKMSAVNANVAPTWGKVVSVEWKDDGYTVQGWLVYPSEFSDANGRRYPMIVTVHGGPAAAVGAGWLGDRSQSAVFSRAGYFVFMPNPRGSYGQGEAFTRANVKDFGHGDLRDMMTGLDTVTRGFPVDSTRMGLTGWSYGGYMTMWTVTQTGRFRAAVAGAGISDWLSYTGENGIAEWMLPYFGATAYDDPAVYAKSSPIDFIRRAHTPTLVVVGERDVECPAPQSYEFWRGLVRNGVTSQLIVYPDEGHGIRDPAHTRDLQERTMRWFDQYLKTPAT